MFKDMSISNTMNDDFKTHISNSNVRLLKKLIKRFFFYLFEFARKGGNVNQMKIILFGCDLFVIKHFKVKTFAFKNWQKISKSRKH